MNREYIDDPYLIPGRNVLRNKFGITDKGELAAAEHEIVAWNMRYYQQHPIAGNFDYEHLLLIHKKLFGDIYDWAGQVRVIDMEKGEVILGGRSIEYTDCEDIQKEASEVMDEMKSEEWGNFSSAKQITTLGFFWAALWKIHPFREGNTRAISEFTLQYAKSQDIHLDIEHISKNSHYVRATLVAASAKYEGFPDKSEPKHLVELLNESRVAYVRKASLRTRVEKAKIRAQGKDGGGVKQQDADRER